MVFSRSTHLPVKFPISFFFIAEYYSIVYAYHIFIIHSFVKEYLGCFHSQAIVHREAMNIDDQVYVEKVVESFGHMPRNGIAGY